jgi:hypothetical protein
VLPEWVAESTGIRIHFEKALRDGDVVPQQATTVAVSLDGVLAPMKDGGAQQKRQQPAEQGRLTRGPAGYREVGCGTLSFCDGKGEMLSAVRMARMPEPHKATLKRTLLADVTAALAERPELRIVKLADGANDNWTFLSSILPGGVEILDFFHAAEHLNAALGSVYGDGTLEARRRFEDLRFVLREAPDGVESVIRSLNYLRKRHPLNKSVTKDQGAGLLPQQPAPHALPAVRHRPPTACPSVRASSRLPARPW